MRLTKEKESKIISMLQSDRSAGFRMLFDEYYMPLCLFSLQMTDDFDAAEDIVQSFFVKFWEKDLHNSIDSNLHYYLFKSIRNNTLQYLSTSGIINSIDVDSSLTDDDMLHHLMYEDYDDEQLRQREAQLYSELQALPEKEREALHNIILNDMSYKEAAHEMGITVNTLKTHLRRAMKKLRESNLSLLLLLI